MTKQKRQKKPRRVLKRARKPPLQTEKGSILELCGVGKEIWANVDADEYVRRLREG
jgi:hypothetical protein